MTLEQLDQQPCFSRHAPTDLFFLFSPSLFSPSKPVPCERRKDPDAIYKLRGGENTEAPVGRSWIQTLSLIFAVLRQGWDDVEWFDCGLFVQCVMFCFWVEKWKPQRQTDTPNSDNICTDIPLMFAWILPADWIISKSWLTVLDFSDVTQLKVWCFLIIWKHTHSLWAQMFIALLLMCYWHQYKRV